MLVAVFVGWTVVCPFANDHRAGCWFLPPIALVCYTGLLRPQVVADRDRIHVRNHLRSFDVAWPDVEQVRLGPQSPLQLITSDGTVARCAAGKLNPLAIMQNRRSHVEEMADDLAARAAAFQTRPIERLGGASTFTDDERTAVKREFARHLVISIISLGPFSHD